MLKKISIFLTTLTLACIGTTIYAAGTGNLNSVEISNKVMIEGQTYRKDIVQKDKYETIPKNNSLWYTVAMYIPNRVIDLSDILTLGVGFGPEASLELTMTKWGQVGASYGDRYFLEKGYNRQYGVGYSAGYNASFLFLNNENICVDNLYGNIQNYTNISNPESIYRCPCKPPYSNGKVDFWRLGIKGGWIIDIELAFHPIAAANFFTGFFFVRLTNTSEI